MASESDALLKVVQQGFAVSAAFWLELCSVTFNPSSYVPFLHPQNRKDPAR